MSRTTSGRTLPSVCLVSNGINQVQVRLQPWHYLIQVARQLASLGHDVSIYTNRCGAGDPDAVGRELRIYRLANASQPWWRRNEPLYKAIATLQPDVLLFHVGLTSFLSQRFRWPKEMAAVGVFTSPLYTFGDLSRVGWRRLMACHRLSAIHLLGTLAPRSALRLVAKRRPQLRHLVVQTEQTRRRLRSSGIWTRPVSVIPPGVDSVLYAATTMQTSANVRTALGVAPSDPIILYFGPASPLRGLCTLIDAFCRLGQQHPGAKLLILNRTLTDGAHQEGRWLRTLLSEPEIRDRALLVDGCLEAATLAAYLRAADVVALPFELVSSDAPLSVLEAHALGKRLVTTSVPGLPDLFLPSPVFRSEPGDPVSLAQALHRALTDPHNYQDGTGQFSMPTQTREPLPDWKNVGARWSQLLQNL